MFLVAKDKNEAISLKKKTFQELKLKERQHLQEWICKNTDLLGEKLLIIQKEFSGFDDTKERLDLLAIDEAGNLVIIENKLDDSGKDVVWQSLKYASYCSGLTKSEIRDIFQDYINENGSSESAEEKLTEFLGTNDFTEIEMNNEDQRIILVAANFRKEVTSTVMWLLDHNIRVKCIKVTPFEYQDNVFIDTEQIIPIIEAEEYLIKVANKKQEEFANKEKLQNRHKVRIKFWTLLLQEMKKKSDLFSNISPSKENWVTRGSGHTGIFYAFVITGNYCRVELYINTGDQVENKGIFDHISEYKPKIESDFGNVLFWQRLDDAKSCRISYRIEDVNVFNEDDWSKIINFLTENMIKLEKSMKGVLGEIFKK